MSNPNVVVYFKIDDERVSLNMYGFLGPDAFSTVRPEDVYQMCLGCRHKSIGDWSVGIAYPCVSTKFIVNGSSRRIDRIDEVVEQKVIFDKKLGAYSLHTLSEGGWHQESEPHTWLEEAMDAALTGFVLIDFEPLSAIDNHLGLRFMKLSEAFHYSTTQI